MVFKNICRLPKNTCDQQYHPGFVFVVHWLSLTCQSACGWSSVYLWNCCFCEIFPRKNEAEVNRATVGPGGVWDPQLMLGSWTSIVLWEMAMEALCVLFINLFDHCSIAGHRPAFFSTDICSRRTASNLLLRLVPISKLSFLVAIFFCFDCFRCVKIIYDMLEWHEGFYLRALAIPVVFVAHVWCNFASHLCGATVGLKLFLPTTTHQFPWCYVFWRGRRKTAPVLHKSFFFSLQTTIDWSHKKAEITMLADKLALLNSLTKWNVFSGVRWCLVCNSVCRF